MITLPNPRIVVDQVPQEARAWVEKALAGPLNRFLTPVRDMLSRLMLSQLNVQVLEYRGFPPTDANPADFSSDLTGPCLGVVALAAREMESNGALADAAGGLLSPTWTEVVTSGSQGSTLRVTSQVADPILTSNVKYYLRWMAVGG